jgi:hydrogenase nickel incorporation protein HypA/HybF
VAGEFWICHLHNSFREFVNKIDIMHEISIASDLSSIVLETARNENLLRVTRVNISFGRLIQIVPDIFEYAFREAVRDSVAHEAELDIEVVEIKMRCLKCGNDFHLEDNRFFCNVCQSADIDIIHGKELFIKSIEGEK